MKTREKARKNEHGESNLKNHEKVVDKENLLWYYTLAI